MSWSEDVAQLMYEAHRLRLDFMPLRQGGQAVSEEAAYDVQDRFVARLCDELRSTVVGYKIGLTSATMQKMCGVATPIYGCILGKRVHHGDTPIDVSDYGRLGVEFEVAVRVGKDVTVPPATWNGLADYVDAVAPAFE